MPGDGGRSLGPRRRQTGVGERGEYLIEPAVVFDQAHVLRRGECDEFAFRDVVRDELAGLESRSRLAAEPRDDLAVAIHDRQPRADVRMVAIH